MIPEEFETAVEKVLSNSGFDLKVVFSELEKWDEAIFLTLALINEKEKDFLTIQESFKVEYLLENGNVITIAFRPTPMDLLEE
ncbi:hypothetical protein [Desulfurobacterium indicum]|uniref:Uncharacterized protein n=1 Tax=Desulfurobacterium indicum TaxID=1914305 RepID=A0A1R1MKN4_9BACT|nr:hypothetical protein [Desulfurobacterium indicum]OMH40378.1 hypothetical protein BLW93_05480 [Desulfurobacterium indicum]